MLPFCCPAITSPDDCSSSVYLTMQEVGLGLISVSLVVCYGLIVDSTRQRLTRRTVEIFAPSDAERGVPMSQRCGPVRLLPLLLQLNLQILGL